MQEAELGDATLRLLDLAKKTGSRELVLDAQLLRGRYQENRKTARSGETQELRAERNNIGKSIIEMAYDIDELQRATSLEGGGDSKGSRKLRIVSDSGVTRVSDGDAKSQELRREESLDEVKGIFGSKYKEERLWNNTAENTGEASLVVQDLGRILKSSRARRLFRAAREAFRLQGVSFALHPGQILAVVGPNGSGKTTLMKTIVGELAPDSGELIFPGVDKPKRDWRRLKERIAYVPQNPKKWFGTVEEELSSVAAHHGQMGEDNRFIVEFFLWRLDLIGCRSSLWSELSRGLLARCDLARALVWNPEILVLDEPLAPLDVNSQLVFLKDIRDIARSSDPPVPVVITSHHIHEIEAIADSILFIDSGRVVYGGDIGGLQARANESVFEFLLDGSEQEILNAFEALRPLDIRRVGSTYFLTAPLECTGKDVLRVLVERGVEIQLFRDITGSTRKLFGIGAPDV